MNCPKCGQRRDVTRTLPSLTVTVRLQTCTPCGIKYETTEKVTRVLPVAAGYAPVAATPPPVRAGTSSADAVSAGGVGGDPPSLFPVPSLILTSVPPSNPDPERGRKKQRAVLVCSPEFLLFWDAYPRKEKKMAAIRAWEAQQPNSVQVQDALRWQKLLPDWNKDGGQYIPLPASYLNDRRWEDERREITPGLAPRALGKTSNNEAVALDFLAKRGAL